MTSKKVFVTGGTGSVGQALVKAFSEAGYHVTFQYYNNERQAQELAKTYDSVSVCANLLNERLPLNLDDFDILINNAGINISSSTTHKVSLEDWDSTIKLNLTVPFLLSQQVIPSMIKRGRGCIINISSIYAIRAVEGNLPYTVSKHGLTGLTKTIAKEYAHLGINCNEICPGPIESEMMKRISRDEAKITGGHDDDYLEEVKNFIPLKRLAEPIEISKLALFLASPEASYITGVSIVIDGGMTIS